VTLSIHALKAWTMILEQQYGFVPSNAWLARKAGWSVATVQNHIHKIG